MFGRLVSLMVLIGSCFGVISKGLLVLIYNIGVFLLSM